MVSLLLKLARDLAAVALVMSTLAVESPHLNHRSATIRVSGSSIAHSVFEIQNAERWMHGRQPAAFTPHVFTTRWVAVDQDARKPDGSRVLSMRLQAFVGGSDSAMLTLDSRGRPLAERTTLSAQRATKYPLFSAVEYERLQLVDGDNGEVVALPASRLWELVPTLPPSKATTGTRWIDTLHFQAAASGFAQKLDGIRISRVVGDTSVADHHYTIVHDSAYVRYEEHAVREERTLDKTVVITHRAKGVIVGRYLFDSTVDAFLLRDDTTRLAGTALLTYPDGRVFRTPANFERVRHFVLYARAEYDRHIAQRDSSTEEFSIVRRPEGTAEQLARGDVRIRDSLLADFSRSRDPEKRAGLYALIRDWSREPFIHDTLRSRAIAGGDSALGLTEANRIWMRGEHPMDVATMRQLLRIMSDPSVSFSLGLHLDVFYENAADALLAHPPASIRDTSDWPCAPKACQLLAAQWPGASEPRLRALGLLARFVLDPKAMRDSVVAAPKNLSFISGAQTLAIAASAPSRGCPDGALPSEHSDWRAWNRWLTRLHNWHLEPRVPWGDARLKSDSLVLFRFADQITDRDLQREWRALYSREKSDSGRSVLGYLLLSAGEVPDDTASIADVLVGAPSARSGFATLELMSLLESHSHVADSALSDQQLSHLLAVALDGVESWPLLHPAVAREGERLKPHRVVEALDGAYGSQERPVRGSIILYRTGVPPRVLLEMQRRGIRIVDSAYSLPSNESAIVLLVGTPKAIGPFLMLSLTHHHEQARINGRGQSWSSGATYYLMRTEAGWKIVTSTSWIT